MKKYIIPTILALAVIASLASYHKGFVNGKNKAVETIIERRDTLTLFDTLKVVEPKYIAVKVVDTIRVPVPVPGKTDTLYAELPREQKTYKEDSLYLCTISGYQPQLDTLIVFPNTTIITTTNTVMQLRDPRFSLGIQAGYGVSKTGMSPYIGVGVSYNIISFGKR